MSGSPTGAADGAVGSSFEVRVGAVAHGGHCVARHEGRVVFVRHALPDELVRVVVTDGGPHSSYWRADAVEVLEAGAGRVAPPCPWAGPGRCGGCDWQHASLETQRALKAQVVREQLARLAGIEREVVVEAVPGDRDGLDWRTRVTYAVDATGRAGLRAHRSHRVVPLDRCRIAHPLVQAVSVADRTWPPEGTVDISAAPGTGERVVLVDGAVDRGLSVLRDNEVAVVEAVGGRTFRVSGGGFWQVHPGAPEALRTAVLDALDPHPGDKALDLYGGVGLFAAALAQRVGPEGRVTLIESDRVAVADARHNLADLPAVRIERGRVDHVLRRLRLGRADVVVLDPPRSGAGRAVVELVSRVRARRVAYVACDPAALARDLKWFAERDYILTDLRAFDLFPMTHHIECVATLVRG
ncbi:MAG: class I SAM-dependent RNA methyltransferase [Actinomycetes bacterium]